MSEEVTGSIVPTVDEIVTDLRDHVWTLIRAGQVDAALVLISARVDDYRNAAEIESRAALVPLFEVRPLIPVQGPVGAVE